MLRLDFTSVFVSDIISHFNHEISLEILTLSNVVIKSSLYICVSVTQFRP